MTAGPLLQHVGERPADVAGAARQRKNPVRLVVHQRERAVAVERDDAVAQAADDVPEKRIFGRRRATAGSPRGGPQRTGSPVVRDGRGYPDISQYTVGQLDREGQTTCPRPTSAKTTKNRVVQ